MPTQQFQEVFFSPPEYQKRALAREARERRNAELIRFTEWLAEEIPGMPLAHLDDGDIASMVSDYLDHNG